MFVRLVPIANKKRELTNELLPRARNRSEQPRETTDRRLRTTPYAPPSFYKRQRFGQQKKNEPASAHTSTHRKENAKTKFAETAKKDAERDEPPDSAPMRPPPRRCRKFGKKNRTQSLTRPLFLCYSNAFRFDFKRSDFNRCLNRQKEERGGTTSFSLIRDAPIGRS